MLIHLREKEPVPDDHGVGVQDMDIHVKNPEI
jgi:hypothetical protein